MNKPFNENEKHRRARAFIRRKNAAEFAADTSRRPQHSAVTNQDNDTFEQRPMAFSKGIEHNHVGTPDQSALTTLLGETSYSANSIPEVKVRITAETSAKKCAHVRCTPREDDPNRPLFRVWESPLAGHYYTLEGPDPDAVSLAPAPSLGESELTAEIAEVYAMALTRDMRFDEIGDPDAQFYFRAPGSQQKVAFKINGQPAKMSDLTNALDALPYFKAKPGQNSKGPVARGNQVGSFRRRTARSGKSGALKAENLFRGSSPGCFEGDLVSQFMLIGGGGAPAAGMVPFGAQEIDQKISSALPGLDYMTSFPEWLDVQNGVNLSGLDVFEQDTEGARRQKFLETPRDMATYVHIDQLYQAYFNACLLMLDAGIKPDVGFPNSDAHVNNQGTAPNDRHQTRTGFATFGGPHVLSLMTEVASRALRAVRRQKFQLHRRARPERLAALITLAANDEWDAIGTARPKLEKMLDELGIGETSNPASILMEWVNTLNATQNGEIAKNARRFDCVAHDGDFAPSEVQNYLLPMAYPEGSPMHPSYGAGHATVAGACVTILKAFFQLHAVQAGVGDTTTPLLFTDTFGPSQKAAPGGECLQAGNATETLTVEGELNKLAANISIGRNMAGVHYYSDYFDSLRMGERIAVGILQEQMLTYNEPVQLTFHSFDGDRIEIATTGGPSAANVTVSIVNAAGVRLSEADWWTRHAVEVALLS